MGVCLQICLASALCSGKRVKKLEGSQAAANKVNPAFLSNNRTRSYHIESVADSKLVLRFRFGVPWLIPWDAGQEFPVQLTHLVDINGSPAKPNSPERKRAHVSNVAGLEHQLHFGGL